jgi:hypothetical protein
MIKLSCQNLIFNNLKKTLNNPQEATLRAGLEFKWLGGSGGLFRYKKPDPKNL